MNWGHRFKEMITRNWREKLISLLLAFLFWFMIKAQDARHASLYPMPPPARISPPSSPAPPELTPVLPTPDRLPSQLEPTVSPPGSTSAPGAGIGGPTGL